MQCTSPREVWPACPPAKGIVFSAMQSYNGAKSQLVPCGRCIGCRLNYSQQWGTRVDCERRMHEFSAFCTLTYDDDHLPPDYSVDIDEIQRFWKRYRRWHPDRRIRYMVAGEYGEQTLRPHYHVALFGWDFPDRKAWRKTNAECLSYVSDELTQAWGLGNCELSDLNVRSGEYVARYMLKKVNGDAGKDYYRRVHPLTGEICQVKPEFMVSSRKPGLGRTFFDKYRDDIFNHGFIVIDGKRRPIPDYFLTLFSDAELADLKRRRLVEITERIEALRARGMADEQGDGRLLIKHESNFLRAKRLERGD